MPFQNCLKSMMNMQVYVLVQFVVLLVGLVFYMNYLNELSQFYKITILALIILSVLNCGAIMENKKWVNIVEIVRFAAFLPLYNTLYLFNYKVFLWHTIVGSSVLVFVFLIWITINQLFEFSKRDRKQLLT